MYKSETKFDSKQNWLLITFLLIPFIASTLKNNGNVFAGKGLTDNFDQFLEIIQLKITLNDGLIIFGFALLMRLLIFLGPFLFITFIELKNKKFKDTTIGRLKYSEGKKYADIWYFAIQFLVKSFQQITVFTTLGLILFIDSLSDLFHNICLLYTSDAADE